MNPVIYRIDEQDRLLDVNQEWITFAEANVAFYANPAAFLGRALWDFVTDPTVWEIYRLVLNNVRSGRTITFDYRCDSPGQRREFEMTVNPYTAARVEFVSTPRNITERTPVRLFDVTAPRSDESFIRMCGWCHAIGTDTATWMPLETALVALRLLDFGTVPQITHGICEPCAERMFAVI